VFKLGIIGSENSHSYSLAALANVEKRVPLCITHLWGENATSAQTAAEKGRIPHIVADWREMCGAVDAVMIAHRDGAPHYECARHFIDNRIPTFIDKPITTNLDEARDLLERSSANQTPVCTFGLIPTQTAFREFKKKAQTGQIIGFSSRGHASINGPHGGIFFYGFHQVDAMIEILGHDIDSISLTPSSQGSTAHIRYKNGRDATMEFTENDEDFQWHVDTDLGQARLDKWYDEELYLPFAQTIYDFIRAKKSPWSPDRMLAPIAVLEALIKSHSTGIAQKYIGA
jgi:hypothetical protein